MPQSPEPDRPPPLDMSVVLPAYNEVENLAGMTQAALETLRALGGRFEIIIVDDGSQDGTPEQAHGLADKHPEVRVVQHPRNRGYGAALRSGFAAARFPWVFFTDADGQFDCRDLTRLLPLAPQAGIVAGYRLRRRDPWHRRLYGFAFTHLVARLLLGVHVRDPNCAFKLVRRDLLATLDLKSEGALINAELLGKAVRAGVRVLQVGVQHKPRRCGTSSGGSSRVIAQALRELPALRAEIRAHRRWAGCWLPTIAALLTLAACTRTAPEGPPPFVRLAPLVEKPHAPQPLRVGDDWRLGLTPVQMHERVVQTHFIVPDAAEATVTLALPPLPPGFRRELSVVTGRPLGEPVVRHRTVLETGGPRDALDVRLRFEPSEIGEKYILSYRWRDIPERPQTTMATRIVRIPEGSEISVSLAATDQPAGRFRIDVETSDGKRERVFEGDGPRERRAWLDVRASLAALAGKSGRFLFGHEGPPSVLPYWGNPVIQRIVATPPTGPLPPSFILVSLDTQRADRMSIYGAERPTTPRLAKLVESRGGLVFERALTQAPSTAPSHMTLFTGVMPCVHGILGLFWEERLPKGLETVTEVLHRNGYRTRAVTEDAYVAHTYGFTRGFDRFVEVRGPESATNPIARRTFATARDNLTSLRDDAPFFLFVHTYQVHAPYLPPPGYVRQVTGRDHGPATPAVDLYDAETLYLDELLGSFLDEAASAPLHGSTYVFVFSDHGEEFSDHGSIGHADTLYEEQIRVPLIVWGPDIQAGRVAGEWGLIDIAPTMLELADLPPWPRQRGQSFAQVLRGGRAERRGPLFAETAEQSRYAVIQGRRKIIHHAESGDYEIFDLDRDPLEQRGATPTGEALEQARAAVEGFARHCIETRTALGLEPTHEQAAGRQWIEWDAKRIEKLKALGYLE